MTANVSVSPGFRKISKELTSLSDTEAFPTVALYIVVPLATVVPEKSYDITLFPFVIVLPLSADVPSIGTNAGTPPRVAFLLTSKLATPLAKEDAANEIVM